MTVQSERQKVGLETGQEMSKVVLTDHSDKSIRWYAAGRAQG